MVIGWFLDEVLGNVCLDTSCKELEEEVVSEEGRFLSGLEWLIGKDEEGNKEGEYWCGFGKP